MSEEKKKKLGISCPKCNAIYFNDSIFRLRRCNSCKSNFVYEDDIKQGGNPRKVAQILRSPKAVGLRYILRSLQKVKGQKVEKFIDGLVK